MTKKPAFSLMEVMVILLILAVTLAATAPMISKKMSRTVGTAENPWRFTVFQNNPHGNAISFNGANRSNASVLIGTDRIGGTNGIASPISARRRNLPSLYIRQRHIRVEDQVRDDWRQRNYEATIRYDSAVGMAFANRISDGHTNVYIGQLGVRDSVRIGLNDHFGQICFGGYSGPGYNKTYFGSAIGGNSVHGNHQDNVLRVVQNNPPRIYEEDDHHRLLDPRVIMSADGIGANGIMRNVIAMGSFYNSASSNDLIALGHNLVPALGEARVIRDNNDINRTERTVLIGACPADIRAFVGPNNNVVLDNLNENIHHNDSIAGQPRSNFVAENNTAIGNRTIIFGEGMTIIGRATVGGISGAHVNGVPLTFRASSGGTAVGAFAATSGRGSVAIGEISTAGWPQGSGVNNNDWVADSQHSAVAIGNSSDAEHTGAIHIGAINDGANADRAIKIDSSGVAGAADSENCILIGGGDIPSGFDNSVAIGWNARVNAPNQIMLGSSNADGAGSPHMVVIPTRLQIGHRDASGVFHNGQLFFNGDRLDLEALPDGAGNALGIPVSSDIRLKDVGEKLASGIEDIKKLEFFNYTYKNDKEKKPHVGVMAQDLQKVFPASVTEGKDGYLTIRWDEMFYAALNAIKELDRKILALAVEVKEFFSRVDKLDLRVAKNQSALDDLKAECAEIDARLARLEKE